MAGSPVQFLLERFAGAGDELALINGEEAVSYRQLLDLIEEYRENLCADGVEAGSVILLKGDFSKRSVAALLALFDIGAIVILLAPSSFEKAGEFTELGEAEFVLDSLENKRAVRTDRTASHEIYAQLKEQGEAGMVIFTSGSSGQSKGVVHMVRRQMSKFQALRHNFRTLSFLLFDHIAGFDTLFYCLSNASAIVTVNRREPDAVCAAIARHGVEVLPTAPSFLNLMLVSKAHERHDLSSLKIVTYGSEVMPQSTLQHCAKVMPHVKMVQRYGTSELGSPRSHARDDQSRWISLGGDGVKWRVVEGQLEIKSASSMLGYLNAPSPFTPDGYFITGDRVEVDGEFVRFLGRDSDIINIGGQKVFPAEIEGHLQDCDLVADVAVYGEPNPLLGSIVACQIQPVDIGANAAQLRGEIKKYLSGRVEAYKIPQKIIITTEALVTERFKKIRSNIQ